MKKTHCQFLNKYSCKLKENAKCWLVKLSFPVDCVNTINDLINMPVVHC